MNPFNNNRHRMNFNRAFAATLGLVLTTTATSHAFPREPVSESGPDETTTSNPKTLDRVEQRVRKIETLIVAVRQLQRDTTTDTPASMIDFASLADEIAALRDQVTKLDTKDFSADPSAELADDSPTGTIVGFCPVMPPMPPDDMESVFARTTLLRRIDRLAEFAARTGDTPAARDEPTEALREQMYKLGDDLTRIDETVKYNETQIATMNTILDNFEDLAGTHVRIAFDFNGLYTVFDEVMDDLGRTDEDNRAYVDRAFEIYRFSLTDGDFEQMHRAKTLVGQAGRNKTRIANALNALGELFDRIQSTEAKVNSANQ